MGDVYFNCRIRLNLKEDIKPQLDSLWQFRTLEDGGNCDACYLFIPVISLILSTFPYLYHVSVFSSIQLGTKHSPI